MDTYIFTNQDMIYGILLCVIVAFFGLLMNSILLFIVRLSKSVVKKAVKR